MKPVTLLISFSPWILFGVLSGHSLLQLEIILAIAMVISIIVGYKDLVKKLTIPWATLLFFVAANILITILHQYWIIPFLAIISNATLTGIAFGTLAVGSPFTMQYAKMEIPPERWSNPVFIRINQVMTAFWGVLFFIGLAKSVYEIWFPDALGVIGDASLWLTIIVGVFFTMKYPEYAKRRTSERLT